MANGNGRDSNENLMAALQEVLDEPTQESKLDHLTKFTFGNAATVLKQIRHLRACLPWQPWMVRIFGGVGIVGVAGVVWAAAGFNANYRETAKKAIETSVHLEAVEASANARFDRLARGMVSTDAKLDLLLQARGIKAPTERQLEAAQARLGLDSGNAERTMAPATRGRF
jgi:hypothetical protein